MISAEDKQYLEQALKGHLSSLPQGGDIPPPPVDPNNITGINDPDEKPEIHLASPEGPKKMTGPMDYQSFRALPRSQRQKLMDAGMAPKEANPRGYVSPGQSNQNVQNVMRAQSNKAPDPKVEAGENSAEQPRTQDSDLLFPPQKVTHMSEDPAERMTPSPPPVPANAGPPPGQAVKPGAGGPLAALAAQTVKRPSPDEMQQAQDFGTRQRRIAGIGEAADSLAHQPMNLADFAISRAGGHVSNQGPDTQAWQNMRHDADRPMAMLAQRTAAARQAEEDAIGNRLKASETGKNDAEAYKELHPESKSPAAADVSGFESQFPESMGPGGYTHEQLAAMDKEGLQNAFTEAKSKRDRTASIEAQKEAQATGSALALRNAKAEADYKNKLPINTPEALVEQWDGALKTEAALDQFEKNADKVSDLWSKATSKTPGASSGLLGDQAARASTYNADRRRTAIAGARGLEGGMARPGNVETVESMLPEATDSKEVKAEKMAQLRAFVKHNREALRKTIDAGNYKFKPGDESSAGGDVEKTAPNGSKYILHKDGTVTPL